MTDLIDAKIIIEFKIKDCISEQSLHKEYGGNLKKCVKWLIEQEGSYLGLVEDEYKLISVEYA